tara:strand:+ start:617 stop:1096 length:480 start_codon:yes stop_codon:yes gene_type:complete
MARPESKLYADLKKITKDFKWTRLENWASLGTPDLLGFHPKKFFFTLELKVTKRNKVALSPHQVAWHLSRGPGSFVLVHYIYKKNKKNFSENHIASSPGSLVLAVSYILNVTTPASSTASAGVALLRCGTSLVFGHDSRSPRPKAYRALVDHMRAKSNY